MSEWTHLDAVVYGVCIGTASLMVGFILWSVWGLVS